MNAKTIETVMNGQKTTQIVDGDAYNSHPRLTEQQIENAAERLVASLLSTDKTARKLVKDWCAALQIRDVADLEYVALHCRNTVPGFHWDRDGMGWIFYMN